MKGLYRLAVLCIAGAAVLVLPSAAFGQIADASTSPGSASASAVNIPGLLVLNKSTTTSTSSHATVLSVAGQELLGNTNGTSTGALAPVGDIVGTVNHGLCPKGALDPTSSCIVVLYGNSTDNGSAHNASAILLGIDGPVSGLNVAGSATSSSTSPTTGCTDLAEGYLLVNKAQFTNPPKNQMFIVSSSTSLGQPC